MGGVLKYYVNRSGLGLCPRLNKKGAAIGFEPTTKVYKDDFLRKYKEPLYRGSLCNVIFLLYLKTSLF